jgi:hypothetical protein
MARARRCSARGAHCAAPLAAACWRQGVACMIQGGSGAGCRAGLQAPSCPPCQGRCRPMSPPAHAPAGQPPTAAAALPPPRRERKLQEQAQQALAECTFAPRINDKSFELQAYRPIHERLGEVLRQRHERMMRSKLRAEQEGGDASFRPRLNSRSLQMAERARWGAGALGFAGDGLASAGRCHAGGSKAQSEGRLGRRAPCRAPRPPGGTHRLLLPARPTVHAGSAATAWTWVARAGAPTAAAARPAARGSSPAAAAPARRRRCAGGAPPLVLPPAINRPLAPRACTPAPLPTHTARRPRSPTTHPALTSLAAPQVALRGGAGRAGGRHDVCARHQPGL